MLNPPNTIFWARVQFCLAHAYQLMMTNSESNSSVLTDAPVQGKTTSRSRRRKATCSKEEHGNTWAKGAQWNFLESRIHLYFQACKDKAWDAFYEKSVDAWVAQGYRLEEIGRSPLDFKVPGEEEAYNRYLRKRAKNVSPSSHYFIDISTYSPLVH